MNLSAACLKRDGVFPVVGRSHLVAQRQTQVAQRLPRRVNQIALIGAGFPRGGAGLQK